MKKKSVPRQARRVKKPGVFWWNLAVTGLGLVTALAVDAILAWSGIFAQHEGFTAWAHAAVSLSFTAFAIVLASAAGAMKADQRPEQKRRAFGAMVVAFAMMTVPAGYAAGALAFQERLAAFEEYSGSDAEAADRRLANDETADSRERANAAEALKQGQRPEAAKLDGSFWVSFAWVGFVLLLNTLAVRAGRRAAPETEAQARRRRAKAKGETPKRGKVEREPLETADIIKLRA